MNQYFKIKNDIRGALTTNVLLAIGLGIIAMGIVGLGWVILKNGNLSLNPPVSPTPVTPPIEKPSPKATAFNDITGEAVIADHLDVSGCDLEPQVFRLTLGSEIIVQNNSNKNGSLFFMTSLTTSDQFNTFDIDANSSKNVKPSFKSEGRYNYMCLTGEISNPGIIQVVK